MADEPIGSSSVGKGHALIGALRETMPVLSSDDQHIGTIDKVDGDRVVLTKNDPQAGGVHHHFPAALLDRIEGNKVILNQTATDVRKQLQTDDGDHTPQSPSGGLFGARPAAEGTSPDLQAGLDGRP